MFQVTNDLTYITATITALSLWTELQAKKDTEFRPVEAQKIADCAAYAHAALSLVSIEKDDAKKLVIGIVRNILLDRTPEAELRSKQTLAAMSVATESLSFMSLDTMVKKMETDCSDEKFQETASPGDFNPRYDAIRWHTQLKELLERQPAL